VVGGGGGGTDHMYRMGIMAMLFADSSLNKERMVKLALVHDMAGTLLPLPPQPQSSRYLPCGGCTHRWVAGGWWLVAGVHSHRGYVTFPSHLAAAAAAAAVVPVQCMSGGGSPWVRLLTAAAFALPLPPVPRRRWLAGGWVGGWVTAIVGDITPHCGVTKDEKYRLEHVRGPPPSLSKCPPPQVAYGMGVGNTTGSDGHHTGDAGRSSRRR
jgi:hypothetical protein